MLQVVVEEIIILQNAVGEVVILQLIMREIVVRQVVMLQAVIEEAVVLQIVVGEIVVQQTIVSPGVKIWCPSFVLPFIEILAFHWPIPLSQRFLAICLYISLNSCRSCR